MDYHIIFDSCLDFNDAVFTEDFLPDRVPFRITVDGDEMIDRNLSTYELVDKMKLSKNKLTTACASPNEYLSVIQPDKVNFIITISSKLSGSHNSAQVAQAMAADKYPDTQIFIIDSKSAAAGEDLLYIQLKEYIAQGLTPEEINEKLLAFVAKMNTIFILDSLDNLAKNGRIKPTIALIGKMLKIVPICGAVDGVIELVDKVRGKKKAFSRFVEIIAEEAGDAADKILAITHVHANEAAEKLKDAVAAASNFKDIIIFEAGGLSTAYADEAGIIVAFEGK